MSYITVVCTTNLDCPKGKWEFPTKLACRPVLGDYIRASNGIDLEICKITHHVFMDPYLEIELTRKQGPFTKN